MNKPPAFQFYAADFETDTAQFSCEEVGAYMRLLCHQWINGFVPDAIERLASIARVGLAQMKKHWVLLSAKFMKGNDGLLRNPRMEAVRLQQQEFSEQQRQRVTKRYTGRLPDGYRNGTGEATETPTEQLPESYSSTSSSTSTKTKSNSKDSCAEPVNGSTQEPALLTLPLNDHSEYAIPASVVLVLQQLYPAVDVMQQLRNMRGWLDAKPNRRKTSRGVKAFISNWLKREQDHGPQRTAKTNRYDQQRQDLDRVFEDAD